MSAGRAVVIGGTGHIGNAVVRELAERGWEVDAVGRRPRPGPNLAGVPARYRSGDWREPGALDRWIGGHDLVVDAAGPYALTLREGRTREPEHAALRRTDALIRAVHRAGATLAYVSSFTTQTPGGPTATTQGRTALHVHPYYRIKDAVEWRLLQASRHGLPVTIVNPMMCLGPWDEKERQLCFVPLVVTGEFNFAMRHIVNVVDVRDVARALVGAVENRIYGEPILVSGHNLTMAMLYRWLFDLAGVHHDTIELPDRVAMSGAYFWETLATALNLPIVVIYLSPLIVSHYSAVAVSPTQRALGASPRDLSDTLARSVAWYRRIGYC
jgi:nucleoside-diphosphate-sugar epimerase